MHFENWVVTAVVIVPIARTMVVTGLLSRGCHALGRRLEKCGDRGEWPCRS
jgi:hypothetical protein